MTISYLAIAFLASCIPLVKASCDPNDSWTNCNSHRIYTVAIAVAIFAFIFLLSGCYFCKRQNRIRQANLSYIRNAQAQAALAPQNNTPNSFNPMYTHQPSHNPMSYTGPPQSNEWPGPVQNPPPPVYLSAPSSLPSSTVSPSPAPPPTNAPHYPPPSYTTV